MSKHLNPVRTLLGDMAGDDYIKFKYGKRVEAALKALDQLANGPDLAEAEAKLVEALEALRGKKGAGASASGPKSARQPKPAAAPVA